MASDPTRAALAERLDNASRAVLAAPNGEAMTTAVKNLIDLACASAALLREPLDRETLDVIRELTAELEWCGGSPDFNVGGQARVGWLNGPVLAITAANAILARLEADRG